MRVASLLTIPVALLLASAAEAQPEPTSDPDEILAELSDLLVRARFSHTLPAVEALLERDDLTASQRNQALEVRAVTEIALGDEQAEHTLATLYRRDPGHRLRNADLGPSIQAAFARAREKARDGERAGVELGEAQVEAAEAGSPVATVAIDGETDAVQEVILAYREGDDGFTRLTLRRQSPASARARLPMVSGGQLVYYVEALAPSGAALARAGSPDEPLSARLPELQREAAPLDLRVPAAPAEEGSSSILEQWWFWSAVAVVVGASVGGYFLFGPPSEGPAAGSLGQGALQ